MKFPAPPTSTGNPGERSGGTIVLASFMYGLKARALQNSPTARLAGSNMLICAFCTILSTFMKQRTYSVFTSGVDKATEPSISFAPYLDPFGETKIAGAEA
jgi:hypothetical protein